MSVAAAAAAVAAAAAESAFTKLVSRPLLSRGWVGVSVGLGKMLPVRTLRSCVARFRLDTSGWTEPKAGSTPVSLTVVASASEVCPG